MNVLFNKKTIENNLKNFIPEAIANVEVTSLWTFNRIKNFKFVPFIVNC